MKVALLMVMLSMGFPIVRSCSFDVLHPETHYCNADYVIKVIVGRKRMVQLYNDGSFTEPNPFPPLTPDNDEDDGDEDGRDSTKWEWIEKESDDALESLPPNPSDDGDQPPPAGGGGDEQPVDAEAAGPDLGGGRQIDWPGVGGNDPSVPDKPDSPPGTDDVIEVNDEQPAEAEEAGAAPTGGNEIIWPGIQTNHQNEEAVDPKNPVMGENEQPAVEVQEESDETEYGLNGGVNPEVEDVNNPPPVEESVSEEIIRPEINSNPELHQADPVNSDVNLDGVDSSDVNDEQPPEVDDSGPAPTGGRLITWPGIETNAGSEESEPEESNPVMNSNDVNDAPSVKTASNSNIGGIVIKTKTVSVPESLTRFESQGDPTNIANNANNQLQSDDDIAADAHEVARGFALKLASLFQPEVSTNEEQISVDSTDQDQDAAISEVTNRRQKRWQPPGSPPGSLTRPNDEPSLPNDEPESALMMQYSINILKVMKGNVTKQSTAFLYSPPNEAICGVELERKNRYVIMGYFGYNALRITLADYVINLGPLSDAEERHLSRNLKNHYKKRCDDCNIKVCQPTCDEASTSDQCVWRNIWTVNNPRASQFACVRKKNGVCRWLNSLNPTMTPEDLD